MVEPPPNTKVFKAKDQDLDSNEKVLGPLLKENSNRQEAAKQERNKEDNCSITLSTLTASNKNRDNISNIGDNSDQLLTTDKSSNKEDKDSNNRSLPDLGTASIGNYNQFKEDNNLVNRL